MEKGRTLGETLKTLRTQAGMTQTELGEKLSISAQAISKWERDESQPDIETLKKLAEIYGVSVAEIIDPDETNRKVSNPAEPTPFVNLATSINEIPERVAAEIGDQIRVGEEVPEVYKGRYDLYISEEFKDSNYFKTVSYISKKFKIGLAESKKIADNFPYALTGGVTKEEADMLDAYFAEIGVKLKREQAKGKVPYRPMITEKDIQAAKEQVEEDKKYLKKRFIVANITAAVPAIAAIIALLILKISIFENPLLSVYAGLCVYSTIFLLWYPSIVREGIGFIFDLGAELNGCLLFIPKIILCVGLLALTFAISPVIYALSLPRRIKRMKEGDMTDNIFIDDKNFIDY